MEQSTLSRKRPRSPENSTSGKHDHSAAAAAASSALGDEYRNHNKQVLSKTTKRTVASLSDLDSSESESDTPIASSSIESTRASRRQPTEPTSATAQPATGAAASKTQPAATVTAAAAAPARINEYDAIDDELLAAALPVDTLVAIQSLQSSCYVTAAAAQQANKKAQRKAPQSTPAETSGRLVLQHQIYTVFENRTAGNDM
jgi:hypothetical protein